jgi:hypothetical protein
MLVTTAPRVNRRNFSRHLTQVRANMCALPNALFEVMMSEARS